MGAVALRVHAEEARAPGAGAGERIRGSVALWLDPIWPGYCCGCALVGRGVAICGVGPAPVQAATEQTNARGPGRGANVTHPGDRQADARIIRV